MHSLAKDVGDDAKCGHYAVMHAMEEWENGSKAKALRICATHGVSQEAQRIPFYQSLAEAIMRSPEEENDDTVESDLFAVLLKSLSPTRTFSNRFCCV